MGVPAFPLTLFTEVPRREILRSSYTRTCIAPARRISALAEIAVGWRLSKCRDVATLSAYHHRLSIGVEIHRS
jgi:hypothetical protein